MLLRTITQITLDGVTQGNGGASEEKRRNGFERGGWAPGKGDDSTRAYITEAYQRADAFLFGRRTYELFAGAWGGSEQARTSPIGAALDRAPKYVASGTLTEATWVRSSILPGGSGNLAAAVAELKARPGGELQVHGSSDLVQSLLAHDLVDEMTLITIPVVVGQGARLFPDAGPDIAFDVVDSRVDSLGVTITTLRPTGRPQYATRG